MANRNVTDIDYCAKETKRFKLEQVSSSRSREWFQNLLTELEINAQVWRLLSRNTIDDLQIDQFCVFADYFGIYGWIVLKFGEWRDLILG